MDKTPLPEKVAPNPDTLELAIDLRRAFCDLIDYLKEREECRHCKVAEQQGVTHIHEREEKPDNSLIEMTHNTREVEEALQAIEYVLSHPDQGSGDIHADLSKVLHHQLQKAREEERRLVLWNIGAMIEKSEFDAKVAERTGDATATWEVQFVVKQIQTIIDKKKKEIDKTKCYTQDGIMVCYCGDCKQDDYKLPTDFPDHSELDQDNDTV